MNEVTKLLNREPNVIVFARQSFTAMQKDIFTLAVCQLEAGINVQPDLFQNKTVIVKVSTLQLMAERNFQRIRTECTGLAEKYIEIYNEELQKFTIITPFPMIQYSNGIIELTMLAEVAQWFLELKKGYSEYYIRESLSLDTFNKKRIYELCCSFKKRNFKTWKVYDEELKPLLGMKLSEYKSRHKEFGQKIVALSVNAINDKTSLLIDFTRDEDSNGWYTVFKIEEKPKEQQQDDKPKLPQDEKSLRAMQKLKELNVRQDFITKIVLDAELQKSFWKWMSQNKENIENKKFKNVAGVLLVHLGLIEPKF